MTLSEQTSLYDPDTEKMVLGTLMGNEAALAETERLLSENCFYDPSHRDLYQVIRLLDQEGIRPDMLTVFNRMRKEGKEIDLMQLSEINGSCTFTGIYTLAYHLSELAQRREVYLLGSMLQSKALDLTAEIPEMLSLLEQEIKTVLDESQDQVFTFDQAHESLYRQIEHNQSGQSVLTGTPTGFRQLDERSGGLQKSDLVIIAGDTSQGKTSLCTTIALHAAKAGSPVAIYSLEMKKEQVAARMLSMESGIPANRLLYSRLIPEEFEQLETGTARLAGLPVYFDDRSTSNIDTIILSIRQLKKRYNIEGAIIDYLQILNVNMKGTNKEAQMGEVARRLKNLTKELDIWIIALSQLNRDAINPMPTLNRLRDSGQIGEAADIVMLIYRPEVYNRSYPEPFKAFPTQGTAMIDVAKGRNIGLLRFFCHFNPQSTYFYDYYEEEFFETAMTDEHPF